MKNIIISLLFQSIPETIVLVYVAVVFLNYINIDKKKILLIGLLNGTLITLYRNLPLTIGFHTILSMISVTLFIKVFFNKHFLNSFIATLKSLILLTLIEFVVVNIYVKLFSLDINEIINSPLLKTYAVLTNAVFLFIIGYVIHAIKTRKSSK